MANSNLNQKNSSQHLAIKTTIRNTVKSDNWNDH